MVHITDTRTQKVVSYKSAHITETVFAHDQHWEEQSTLSSPQLYRHSQEHRKWITIQQGYQIGRIMANFEKFGHFLTALVMK